MYLMCYVHFQITYVFYSCELSWSISGQCSDTHIYLCILIKHNMLPDHILTMWKFPWISCSPPCGLQNISGHCDPEIGFIMWSHEVHHWDRLPLKYQLIQLFWCLTYLYYICFIPKCCMMIYSIILNSTHSSPRTFCKLCNTHMVQSSS